MDDMDDSDAIIVTTSFILTIQECESARIEIVSTATHIFNENQLERFMSLLN